MSESFVDLSYRGLALGKRIKLTQVRPGSGYLEMPTPMPVGTTIGIATEDGVLIEAIVTDVHEQVTGAEHAPGMLIKPNLSIESQEAWWKARVDLVADKAEKHHKPAPAADAQGKVTLTSRRTDGAIPELMDDGRNTAVMEIIDDSRPDALIADLPHDTAPSAPALPRDTNPNLAALPRDTHTTIPNAPRDFHATIPNAPREMSATIPNAPRETSARAGTNMGVTVEDDDKRTMAMDAVDLAALGLSTSSDQMPAVKPEDYVDDDAGAANSGPIPTGDKPEGKTKKKRSKRR